MMQTQLKLVFSKVVIGLTHHSKLHFQSLSKNVTKGTIKSIEPEKRGGLSITYFSLSIDENFIVEG